MAPIIYINPFDRGTKLTILVGWGPAQASPLKEVSLRSETRSTKDALLPALKEQAPGASTVTMR